MAEHKPDLVINAGDNNGGWYGAKATRTVIKRHREAMPYVDSLAVNGNHEMWVRGRKARMNGDVLAPTYQRPNPESWRLNYEEIQRIYDENNVHFLDTCGPFRKDGVTFVGHSLWYENPFPPTNDAKFMPQALEGDTHAFLRRKAYKEVFDNLDKLTDDDKIRIFISHFPVINVPGDHKFSEFSASEVFGESLQSQWGFTKFLCGHAHQRHEGPLRYEAGSQYGVPKYLIIDIK